MFLFLQFVGLTLHEYFLEKSGICEDGPKDAMLYISESNFSEKRWFFFLDSKE